MPTTVDTPVLTVTEAALGKIKELRAAEEDADQLGLRVEVTGSKGADYTSLAAELKLLTEAAELSESAELAARVEAAPDDHQARYDLALALNAEGKRVEAAEQLVALMKRDRTFADDGARKKLLDFFEAWGAKDPATLKGRRMLSALLFS